MRKNITTKLLLLVMLVLVCVGLSACTGDSDAANVPKDPTVPQMNSAIVADDGVIDVVWNPVTSAEGYEIYKSTLKDGDYTMVGKVAADARVYNDLEAEMYKQHYYKVRAVLPGTETEFSDIISAFTEGYLITNSKMRIAAENENGVTLKYPTGSSLIGPEGKYTGTFIYEDEVCTDFEILYDTERLNVQVGEDGTVIIEAIELGQYIITFVKGDEKGSFLYYPEIGEKGIFTYDWPGNPVSKGMNNLFPVEDSKSAKVPNYMQSLLTVKYNGVVTNDFTVEVSDPEICRVEKNEANVTVTNLMPGKCQIIFSRGEEKTVFEWISKGTRSMCTGEKREAPNGVIVELTRDGGTQTFHYADTTLPLGLGLPQLTDDEIDKLLASKDHELIKETIDTVPDMVNYFRRGKYTHGCSEFNVDGLNYTCSGAQALLLRESCVSMCNSAMYCLKDDYDEVGYIYVSTDTDGHVVNYIKHDGIYYAFDAEIYLVEDYQRRWMDRYPSNNPIWASEDFQDIADSFANGKIGSLYFNIVYSVQTNGDIVWYAGFDDFGGDEAAWRKHTYRYYPEGTKATAWYGDPVIYYEAELDWQSQTAFYDPAIFDAW